MSIHTFDLLFLADGPHGIAHVSVVSYGREGYKGHENTITIAPQCVTAKEVEGYVDLLKKELDEVVKIARKKFTGLRAAS